MPFHQILFVLLQAVSSGYAVIRGGAPERMTGIALVLAAFATRFASQFEGAYQMVVGGVVLIDIVLLLSLLGLALTSARFWPMAMAGMHGCGLLGHFAKALGSDIVPKAYFALVSFWGFPMCVLLLVATWRHRVRLKRYGVDYAWVSRLPRRYRDGWSVDELARPLPQR